MNTDILEEAAVELDAESVELSKQIEALTCRRENVNDASSSLREFIDRFRKLDWIEPQSNGKSRDAHVSPAIEESDIEEPDEPINRQPVDAPMFRERKRPGRPAAPRVCAKHPGAPFGKNRRCLTCHNEDSKKRYHERVAQEKAAAEAVKQVAAAELPPDVPRELEYSLQYRCGQCGSVTRFKRVKGIDQAKGYWVCVAKSCTVKISAAAMVIDPTFKQSAVRA